MLPLSCFLFAVSKSKSSTIFPSSTATRVSSGWAASISIVLAIEAGSIGVARAGPLKAERWRGGEATRCHEIEGMIPERGLTRGARAAAGFEDERRKDH